jgi:hypothetical protein
MTVIGFRIHIDGVLRSFHDIREVAFGMARTLKTRHRHSKVEIIDERTGNAVEMLEDGRIA